MLLIRNGIAIVRRGSPAPTEVPDTADAPTVDTGGAAGEVYVTWDIPSGNGATITGQILRWSLDETAWTNVALGGSVTEHTFDAGAINQIVYVQIIAENIVGVAEAWSASGSGVSGADESPSYLGGMVAQNFDGDSGIETYDISELFDGDNLTFSLTASPDPAITINASTGVISYDTDSVATGVDLEITVRASNTGGTADGSYTDTVSSTASVNLFPEVGLTSLVDGAYDPKDIEDAGETQGAVIVTALTDYLDTTPAEIACTLAWNWVAFEGMDLAASTAYTFCFAVKDVDAGQAVFYINDGDQDDLTIDLSDNSFVIDDGDAGTISDPRTTTGPDGSTYVLFEFTPDSTVTDGKFGLGTGIADTGLSIICYTMAYSEATETVSTPTKWLAVANASGTSPAGHTYGTPSSSNTTVQTTAAAAIAAPLETIQQAVNASTPGTVILVKGNTEASPIQYSGNVTVNASRSGTPGNPLRIVADTYRGVEVLGDTGGGEQSAVYLSNAKYVDLHNLVATCRAGSSQDNAAFKVVNSTNEGTIPVNHIGFYGLHAQGSGSGGRDVIKLAAHRDLTMKGCLIEGANFTQSAIDIVTGIDDVIEYNTFTGVNKEGPAFKGASLRMQFRYNLVDITQQGSSNSVAGLFGELGESRTGRVMPFDGEVFPWAEYHDGTIEYNVFQTDFDECIWFRGASDTVFRYNFLGGHGGSNAIEMKNAPSGMWSDQPTTVPGAYADYATISGSTVTYECRGITITDNWIETGAGTGISQQNSATNTIGSFTAVADYASVPGGVFDDVGEDGFDETAIYTELGLD